MLDLSFVRNNLPGIEEMLRNRGMDPKTVLKDFPNVEAQRRQAIKSAETLKAERNRLSAKIPELKKAGEDATQLVSETKEMRAQIQELEKAAEEYDARMTELLTGIPNMPHASVPVGKSADDTVEVRQWGAPPKFEAMPGTEFEMDVDLCLGQPSNIFVHVRSSRQYGMPSDLGMPRRRWRGAPRQRGAVRMRGLPRSVPPCGDRSSRHEPRTPPGKS